MYLYTYDIAQYVVPLSYLRLPRYFLVDGYNFSPYTCTCSPHTGRANPGPPAETGWAKCTWQRVELVPLASEESTGFSLVYLITECTKKAFRCYQMLVLNRWSLPLLGTPDPTTPLPPPPWYHHTSKCEKTSPRAQHLGQAVAAEYQVILSTGSSWLTTCNNWVCAKIE